MVTEKKKPKVSKYPELWYMFDAVNTLVAGFHEYGDKDDKESEFGFVLQIEDTEYWPVIYDNLRDFGKKVATETEAGNIRELDKLSTIKGGESKKYKGKGGK